MVDQIKEKYSNYTNKKCSDENTQKIGGSNRCLNYLNDLNDLNDLDKKDKKDIKVIKTLVIPPLFLANSLKSSNKEQILTYLYNKIKTSSDIDKELNLSINTTQKVIQRNSELFELDHKELNKKFWKLSFKGKCLLESQIKSFNEKQEQELFIKESKKSELSDEDYNNIIQTTIKILKLKDQMLRSKYIYLDIKELSELNPFLSDIFLDKYEIIKEKFIDYIKINFEKEIIIRPINLPDSTFIDLLDLSSSKHLNKLIKTKGVIEYRSDTKEGIILESKFECPSCGVILTVKHEGESFNEPRKCSCGNNRNFKLLSNKTADFLEIIVRSKDITKTKIRIHLYLQGNDLINYLNKKLSNGKSIEIIGVYKLKQKYIKNKRSNKFIGYISAENIKAINEEFLDVSEQDKINFKEISEDINKNGLNNLIKKIFPSSINVCVGQEVLSKGWILQMVSPENIFGINGMIERRKPHIFCYGDPATDKSRKVTFAKKIDNKIKDVNGSSSSSAGLLLGMDVFENKRFISGGILAEANNSIVIIDEIQKFDKDARGSLHDALASQRLKYNKVGFNIEENVNVCMSFFGNPPQDNFNNTRIYNQIRNPKDDYGNPDSNTAFLSRCDLIIGIRDNNSKDEEIFRTKLNYLKNYSTNDEENNLLKKYIFYVKEKINPLFTKESEDLMIKLTVKLREYIKDSTLRIQETYTIFSRCFAKIRCSDKIEKIDVLRTHTLYLDSLKSLEINIPLELEVIN